PFFGPFSAPHGAGVVSSDRNRLAHGLPNLGLRFRFPAPSGEAGLSIAVIYLARYAEGLDPMRRFLKSYQRYPAGIDHDLIVVFKGFPRWWPKWTFRKVKHRSLTMPDRSFDIGAYRLAAEQTPHQLICCFNTFTEIESANWLAKLNAPMADTSIGIAG